jgi:hypothetical protein
MGDVAEDYVDGSCCSDCGGYFTKDNKDVYTHGYPVLCSSCWNNQSVKEKNRKMNSLGQQKALVGKFH